jgi:hypothetical protein
VRVLDLEIDMTRARVEPAALELLRACSRYRHLPAHIDPSQAECRLILTPMHAPEACTLQDPAA